MILTKEKNKTAISACSPVMNIYRASRLAFPFHNPDWRTDLYSYVANLADDYIAFEFLRRSPAYWAFYRQLAPFPDDPMSWPMDRGPTIEFAFPPDEVKKALDEFGIRRLCDPRCQMHFTNDPWQRFNSLSARYVDALRSADARNDFDYTLQGPRLLTMRVDLLIDGPIDAQIDFVHWLLKRARSATWQDYKKPPRVQPQQLPQYLRLLDARSDGASFSEIAKCLFPRSPARATDRLKKQYKAAVRLRDGGYKNLMRGRVSIPKELQEREPIF